MSTPTGDNFSYGEDTVVAKISVDVPAGAQDSLRSLNQQAEQLKVNLEAMARANSNWLDYLSQIPVMTERIIGAQRTLITQYERMAYLQQEMGSLGNVMPQGGMPGGQQAPYSTAAPAGYVDPFQGMTSGMRGATGVGAGPMGAVPQNMGAAMGYMSGVGMNDPRLYQNIMAQRGVGGAAWTSVQGSAGGLGAAPPGSVSPQQSQTERNAAAPPDSTQSGAPTTSEPTNTPSSPHPDSPAWQHNIQKAWQQAQSILSEARSSASIGAIGGAATMGGSGGGSAGGGGTAPAVIPGGGGPGVGGLPTGLKVGGGAGAAITAGMGINRVVQNAGEQLQKYRVAGMEQGGDIASGVGYDINAAMMAINPFITTEQSRSVIQGALQMGYKGEQFETVTEFMKQNLIDMNIGVNDSMELLRNNVDKGRMGVEELGASLEGLKDLAKGDTRKGLTQLTGEYQQTSAQLSSMGLQGEALDTATKEFGQMFASNGVLAPVAGQQLAGALQNPAFITQMGMLKGITAAYPDAIIGIMQDSGIDIPQAAWDTVVHYAQMVPAGGDINESAAQFKGLMNQVGIQMDMAQAKEYYMQAMQLGGKPGQDAADRVSGAAGQKGIKERAIDAGGRAAKGALLGIPDMLEMIKKGASGDWSGAVASGVMAIEHTVLPGSGAFGSEGQEKAIAGFTSNAFEFLTGEGQLSDFTGGGSSDVPLSDPSLRPSGSNANNTGGRRAGTTQGTVNGELKVTVDQAGRVSAPPTVRLSGNQIVANAGGDSNLNNPGPADATYGNNPSGMS